MAEIYDCITGSGITQGLQGCNVCDDAIRMAERIADERGHDVLLVDDDGEWTVHPRDASDHREPADLVEE